MNLVSRLYSILCISLFLQSLTGCTNTHPKISQLRDFSSLSFYQLTVNNPTLASDTSTTVTLSARDYFGKPIFSGGDFVTFFLTNGTSSGTFANTTTNFNGDYSAVFNATTAGTTSEVRAYINGALVTSSTAYITVNAGIPHRLMFIDQPSNTSSGTAIPTAITVKALDINNNYVSDYGSDIAIALEPVSNLTGATLSGTLTRTPVGGISTFNDLSINYFGTGYILTATSGSLIAVDSNAFDVSARMVTYDWPFSNLAEYVFDSSKIEFTSGIAQLIPTLQTDSEATQISDSTYTNGTYNGVVYTTLTNGPTQGLKLGNGSGCNGVTADCAKQSAAEIYELSPSWTPQWASIAGYWKLDGMTGTGISSAASIAATVGSNGSASNINTAGMSYASGKIGQGINFDGTDDYLTMGVAHRPTTAITISLWIYPRSLGSGSGIMQDYAWNLGNPFGFVLDELNGRIYWRAGSGNPDSPVYTTAPLLTINQWTHLTVTWTSNNTKIYKDGVAVATTGTTNATQIMYTGAGGLTIGRNQNYHNGLMDEIAIWSTTLSDAEVNTIYEKQKTRYSGTFTSRVMDAKSSSAWTTLSWIPTLPFYKELPDSTCSPTPCTHNNSESSANYISLVGSTGLTGVDDLMNGIVGLWHFNETSWSSAPGEVRDSSGQGNHGVGKNGITTTEGGRFSRAGYWDGTNDGVSIPYDATLAPISQIAVSAWFKTANRAIVGQAIFSTTQNGGYALHLTDNSSCPTSTICFVVRIGGAYQVVSTPNTAISPNNWHHVVGKYDGSYVRLYLDGIEVGSSIAISGPIEYSGTSNPCIGVEANNLGCGSEGQYFSGWIDEVAVWNRALHANEITQLYQRGASRLKYQVRSCYDSDCLYKDSFNTPANWQGPDSTSGTYFSELNNNTTPLTGLGDVKATLPSMLFTNFTSPPTSNQYFQYRTIFESESSTAALMPELKSTTVDPIHYPKYLSTDTSPGNTIIGQTSVAFYELNAFTQTLGAGGCSNGVVYNLGLSNTGPWQYWTGAAWATADGSSAQANTAAALVASSNAALTAFATDVGRGSVFFKAFLTSDGTSKCELNNINIQGNH